MEPLRVIYFVYGSEVSPKPLDPGTALYARVYVSEYLYDDYKWNTDTNEWGLNEYLGYLAATGSPDLDNVAEADLPAQVTRF